MRSCTKETSICNCGRRSIVGFVTSSVYPKITSDDLLVANELSEQGVRVEPVPWDSDQVDWKLFDAVVFRSCWNYHIKPTEFQAWLENMSALNLLFLNSPDLIKWNLHKKYLFELQSKGIEIPPSALIKQKTPTSLDQLMTDYNWTKAVVKPAISATAKDTWVVNRNSARNLQDEFNELTSRKDVIVQQFVQEIIQGEISLMFFNKKFSHAILKKPRQGDFRVQNDFGGTAEIFEASVDLVRRGEKIVNSIPERLLYARIDGVISNGKFLLMELELIEPVLFFQHCPIAAEKLAHEIVSAM